ncbi:sensor histidine kinase [Pikeienuella sp. HZG-20]|uniref:sensor histidine kinase n=1 Tax=Paludibacillus litoralis TaxID=3133267 RepID=UPI0030EDFAAF
MTLPPSPPLVLSSALGAALGALGAAAAGGGPVHYALMSAGGAAAAAFIALRLSSGALPPRPQAARMGAPAASGGAAEADSEALFHLPAAVLIVDRERRVRRANAAALTLIGDDGVDIAGLLGAPLVSVIRAPGLIEAVVATLADQTPRSAAFTLIRSRGERALLAHIRPLPTVEPRTPAVLILIEDRTESRQVEEMRRTFIANAGHQLKTPLASIMGFIETLQGPAKDDELARARFLGIMSSQAERMKHLIEDLMALSRIEMGLHARPTSAVDLARLARAAAAALEPVAARAGARISVELADEERLMTTGDPDQLAQVLANLIDNAVKYGGAGVTVTIRAAPLAPEWPGMVGVVVADDGPGIPREHLPRLTERFYRVSDTRADGAGLGLAIAKHILQRHRGELRVRSTFGEGSAFTIWLPRRGDSPSGTEPQAADPDRAASSK